jgi:hypothetical protein
MIYATTSITEKIAIVKTAIEKANLIIIGAGSGLSTAFGLLYDDPATFAEWFPGYHVRYGLQTINEASFYHFPTPEEYYAHWSHLIFKVRYKHLPENPILTCTALSKTKTTLS